MLFTSLIRNTIEFKLWYKYNIRFLSSSCNSWRCLPVMCLFIFQFLEKVFRHTSHVYGFSPVCTLVWTFKSHFLPKVFRYIEHSYFFVWTPLWVVRECLKVKVHTNKVSFPNGYSCGPSYIVYSKNSSDTHRTYTVFLSCDLVLCAPSKYNYSQRFLNFSCEPTCCYPRSVYKYMSCRTLHTDRSIFPNVDIVASCFLMVGWNSNILFGSVCYYTLFVRKSVFRIIQQWHRNVILRRLLFHRDFS